MGLFDEIVRGAATGLAIDKTKDGAGEAARTVAERAGDPEREGDLIDSPRPVELWGGVPQRLVEAGIIEQAQAGVIAVLLSQRDSELQQIVDALRTDSPTTRSRVVYGAVGDPTKIVELPDLPDNGQQWTLDTITAWADPLASGDVLIRLGGQATGMRGNAFPIPCQFAAPRTDVVSKSFKQPARENDAVAIDFLIGGGGAAGDRACIVFNYKRG